MNDTPPVPPPDLRLTELAVGIERHVAETGWDRPALLYALVDTTALLATEPGLARTLGIDPAAVAPGDLTPIEQDELPEGGLDEVLAEIAWPDEVAGCALVHEVLVLPPATEQARPDELPEDDVADWAAAQPDRREVRMVAAVLRDGTRSTVLRVREAAGEEPDLEADVLVGADLAPALSEALLATFE